MRPSIIKRIRYFLEGKPLKKEETMPHLDKTESENSDKAQPRRKKRWLKP